MSEYEKAIEARAVAWAEKRGFLSLKVKFAEKGYPDRLFLSPKGHTIFIEFKRQYGKPDLLQAYRIQELRNRGIPAFCCDNDTDAINILKAALESASLPEKSNTAATVTRIGGPVSRSRFGEDVDGPRYPQDSEDEGAD